MKRLLDIFALVCAVIWFAACTADYDTFGASNYNNFESISFEEESAEVSVLPDEHLIKVSLSAPPESLSTWDSVTISGIKMSHLASLYIVESKFKEFPTDSAALDSLARSVAYSENKLKVDSKLYVPASRVLYILIVSESGEPSIWKMTFSIEGAPEPETEESSSSEGQDPLSSGSNSSSSVAVLSSSSVTIQSAENHLTIKFANALKQSVSNDTIYLKLKSDQTIEKASLESAEISKGATISPKPEEIKAWKEFQEFIVTAEDGSKRTWCLNLMIAAPDEVASSDKELLSIKADGQVKDAVKNAEKKIVTFYMKSATAAKKASISAEISETASINISSQAIMDLTAKQTITITAEDLSSETWTLTAEYYPEPKIISMKINDMAATVDSVLENGVYVHWVHLDTLPFLENLTKLNVSDVVLTEGASADISIEGSQDLSFGREVVVSNGDETRKYEIRAGYQYPNSDFSKWINGSDGYAQLEGWDNGNNQYTKTLAQKYTDGTRTVNKMVSVDVNAVIFKTFASGNTFIADFNPKNVAAISMAGYPDGNELIDFGKPFAGRPKYIEFDAKYAGKGDSCDMYIILESRSAGAEATNVSRASTDENKLVASAWYRATTITDKPNRPVPDLVSVKDIGDGYSTIRLKLQYGEPSPGSPIFNSRVLTTVATELKKPKEGIDNRVKPVDASEASLLDVSHIRIVTASSAAGNLYEGNANATLYLDEIRLIY